jgi:photosystem II stability/assembly factor-like uncharacterized protein
MMAPMKHILCTVSLLLLHSISTAQESTVYAPVVATKLFVVGAANPQTGLRIQQPSDDTTWRQSGPDNIRAFDVAIDPSSGGKVVYMAAGNGLHKTTDGGKHWKIVTSWRITEILGVTLDERNPQTVYLATAYGVVKTDDGGKTWREKNNGRGSNFTSNVIVDHSNSRTVYCSGEDGAYASYDAGDTWQRMNLSVSNVRIIAQHPNDPEMLIAGTEYNGIYVSRNAGLWWGKSEAGVDHTTFYTMAFDPNDDDVIYAGGYLTGVYKSTDRGRSWSRGNEGLTPLTIHALAVDPLDSNRLYAGSYGKGIYRSEDAGAHWRSAGLSTALIWRIHIHPY